MLKTRDKLKPPTVPHAVTSVDDGVALNEYEYDANGNMITRSEFGITWTQTFNAENRLSAISNGIDSWAFTYDGDGNRVKQVNPDGKITLLLGGLYSVEDAAGESPVVAKYYVIAGQRVAMSVNGELNYLLTDHLGSVVAITDALGALLSDQRYMPFGVSRDENGISDTDFGFTGQRSLADVGLMDYNARWYDATLGLFVSADSFTPGIGIPQAWDRYAYVYNNPINFIDPSGFKGVDCGGKGICEDSLGTGIVGGCAGGFGCDMKGSVGNTKGGQDREVSENEYNLSIQAQVILANEMDQRECANGNPNKCSSLGDLVAFISDITDATLELTDALKKNVPVPYVGAGLDFTSGFATAKSNGLADDIAIGRGFINMLESNITDTGALGIAGAACLGSVGLVCGSFGVAGYLAVEFVGNTTFAAINVKIVYPFTDPAFDVIGDLFDK